MTCVSAPVGTFTRDADSPEGRMRSHTIAGHDSTPRRCARGVRAHGAITEPATCSGNPLPAIEIVVAPAGEDMPDADFCLACILTASPTRCTDRAHPPHIDRFSP